MSLSVIIKTAALGYSESPLWMFSILRKYHWIVRKKPFPCGLIPHKSNARQTFREMKDKWTAVLKYLNARL